MMVEHDYKRFPELTNTQLQELQFQSPHKQITEDFDGIVVKVHDGDTITLRTEFRDFDFPLRLIGIDAPEMNKGGKEAREWLKAKILNKAVQVLIDSNNRVDKYGRLLGKVFYQGLDISQEEIYLGLALPFKSRQEGEFPDLLKIFSLKQWF